MLEAGIQRAFGNKYLFLLFLFLIVDYMMHIRMAIVGKWMFQIEIQ